MSNMLKGAPVETIKIIKHVPKQTTQTLNILKHLRYLHEYDWINGTVMDYSKLITTCNKNSTPLDVLLILGD